MKRYAMALIIIVVGVCVVGGILAVLMVQSQVETALATPPETAVPTTTVISVAAGAEETGTPCPQPTPEWLWVDPVTSPTTAVTQTIAVGIGNGDAVTVTAETGVFTVTGAFTAYQPAAVTIDLLPQTTHHLTVQAHVRPIMQGDCPYGNYTLSTTTDRNGQPLVIEQLGDLGEGVYLPLLLN